MMLIKQTILFFAICNTTFFVCTGVKLVSNENKHVIVNQISVSNEISVSEENCEVHKPKCIETGGNCKVDHDKVVQCACPSDTKYHAEEGCLVTVEKCTSFKLNCMETGGICKSDKEKNIHCVCPASTEYQHNKGCQVPEDICKSIIPNCLETGGSCILDKSNTMECLCPGESEYLDGIGCTDSENSKSEFPLCIETGGTIIKQSSKKETCLCPTDIIYLKNIGCKRTCDNFEYTCKNGAQCESRNNYNLCKCKKGTSGDLCEMIDECADLQCPDKTTCTFDQVSEAAFCKCIDNSKTYYRQKKECVDINPCILKMINDECNKDNEYCDEYDGECKCRRDFKYSDDGEFCEEDKCASCPENSVCDPNSAEPCRCIDGYFDGRKCVKYGNCQIGFAKCQQLCYPNFGKCGCVPGFKLSDDNAKCEVISESESCDLNCYPGTCLKKDNIEACICPNITHKSKNGACIDLCTLSDGMPPDGMNCPDKCESDSEHGIRCKCDGLYEQAEDGIHCRRKELCKEPEILIKTEQKSALCKEVDYGRGYEFYCDKWFAFDKDGVCQKKCSLMEKYCQKLNAVCELDVNYNAVCRCPLLLTRKDEKSSCRDIAKFSYTGEISFLKSMYVSNDGSNTQETAFTGLYNIVKLQADLNESVGYVYESNLKDVKIINCHEKTEALLTCKIELQLNNKTEPEKVNALTSPSYCYDIGKGFCVVKNLAIKRGDKDVFKKTDPCLLKDLFCDETTECTPDLKKSNFKCECKYGFKKTGGFPVLNDGTFVEKCADIDECKSKTTNKCPANTTCINTFGSFKCECDEGFRRKSGNLDPKKHGCEAICDPNPCENGGECFEKRNHEFICRCNTMHTGPTCSETVPVKEDNKCVTIIGSLIGTLLVFILVILVIVLVVYKRLEINKTHGDECAVNIGRRALGDATPSQRNENDYVEINLHSNRNYRPREVELQQYKKFSRDETTPSANVSTVNNTDQYLEDRGSIYDVPRRSLDVRSLEDQTTSTMQYMNKAYDPKQC